MTTPAMQGNPFAGQEERPADFKAPMLRHLKDRLIIVVPRPFNPVVKERNKFDKAGGMQDKLVADVIVCDGPAIMYGGTWNETPDTLQFPAPSVIPGMWIYQGPVIEYVMDSASKGIPLGRVRLTPSKTGGNPYYLLERADNNPADVQLAFMIYQQAQAGQLPRFEPPAATTTQIQAAITAPAVPQFGQQPTLANPVGIPMGLGGQMAPVAPAAPAWPAGFGAPPAAAPAAPVDWTLNAMPAGFPPGLAAWQAASVADRTAFLAQQGITGPAQAVGAGTPTGL